MIGAAYRPDRGSFPAPANAGNSNPTLGLFTGVAKGVK